MSVFRNDPQKQVALEEYLQPLEEAFLRKVGREGAKAVSPWSGGAKHLAISASGALGRAEYISLSLANG